MFLGSYYTDCALHELKGKPYSKKKVFWKNLFKAIVFMGLVISLLISTST